MSRPRKPFGATHPGRLPATMMKVLAAEMSDPSRLRRGKQYARDGSVLDIDIRPGVVTCEIQGSRPTPYVAIIEVTRGDGMPLRRDVATLCSCPDDDNWDGYACKHVVAAMFALSDELLVEPELLDLWRGRVEPGREPPDAPTHARGSDTGSGSGTEPDEPVGGPDDHDPRPSRRHLRLVGADDDGPRSRPRETAPAEPPADPLRAELTSPPGSVLPAIPELDPLDPPPPRDAQLATVLRSALAAVRVDWD